MVPLAFAHAVATPATLHMRGSHVRGLVDAKAGWIAAFAGMTVAGSIGRVPDRARPDMDRTGL